MSASQEGTRQQALLKVLWRQWPDAALEHRLMQTPQRAQRGLAAYRANVLAHARRALADIFPTVCALLGDEAFGAMASAYWHAALPEQGDLARVGDRLAAFMEHDRQLAAEPYLADVARLDLAVHRASIAPDAPVPPRGLERLGERDPASLLLVPAAAVAVIESRWPVLRIRAAHAGDADVDAFGMARAALERGEGDVGLVWRDSFRPMAEPLARPQLDWWRAVMAGASLAQALDRAGPTFDFQAWFLSALTKGWLAEVQSIGLDAAEAP